MPLPTVVIIGRPNVGKSSLLNRLAGRRISIVDPTAGVTRDRIEAEAELENPDAPAHPHRVRLVDTGGHGIIDTQNLTADVERQIARGLAEADLILFVIDAQAGVVALDQVVAEMLRKAVGGSGKRVVLVANKVDDRKFEPQAFEAMRLGFGEQVGVSAENGHNFHELRDAIRRNINFTRFDQLDAPRDEGVRVAVVGKRNAGKSTTVNAIAGEERVIVSEQEGTTRDSVDVRVEVDGHVFTLIDTAGLRKRKSVKGDVEYYATHRALRSIRRADVCLLLIDATVPVSQVDQQLAQEVLKHHRPAVVVVNKWDLAEGKVELKKDGDTAQDAYAAYLDKELQGLNFAPIAFTSAIDGKGMRELLALAQNLHEQANHRVGTGELNRAIEQLAQSHAPPSKRGKIGRIYYGTQVSVGPPTIVLFVNIPDLFDATYQRYVLNRLRDELPFSEVPIRLVIRGRAPGSAPGSSSGSSSAGRFAGGADDGDFDAGDEKFSDS